MKNTMKVTIATLCSILLLGSMSAAVQAASSQSFNGITLKTAAAKAPTDAEKKKMFEAEKKKVFQIKKNPGDFYILYVSDKKLNGGSEFLYSSEFPKFTKYEDYKNWTAKLKGAVIQEPEGMPEGYKFVNGVIQNPFKQFDAHVKAEAKGKVVYSKKIEWDEAGMIRLEYANGKNKLVLSLRKIENGEEKKSKEGFQYKSADEKAKENAKQPKNEILPDINNSLSWTEKGVSCTISTNPENPLTKEELIKLAKTMIKK
ncbi:MULTISPECIES: hypothetical protein [unclassified Paenibacillus]|uniref:hypothetical protein n=1 Tax=unclassified Paenibacillus TaxID=185978 RepID=UPI0025A01722|nr:hypothetical protein [Paenibacillus sp. S-12]